MSSLQYQEFITERVRLLERIKELETENAELRKRLGEPVTPAPPALNAMQNLSLHEKIICSAVCLRDVMMCLPEDGIARQMGKPAISQYAKMNRLRYVTNVNANVPTAPIVNFHH
jgi:cell shape-determining protein MreC